MTSPSMQKMIRQIFILTILLVTFSTPEVKADSWLDPNWKEMIENSDVIALVEYTSDGDFRAKAKAVTIYKGKLNSDEIWISGFSNRYGPIDNMSQGDKYIVFLHFYEPTEQALEHWQRQAIEDPDLTEYYVALKSGNAYSVSSPTSGDLKVKRKTVQYDLLQSSYYGDQSYFPISEFETFLKATTETDNSKFHNRILKKLENNISNENCAQLLMMLYLTSWKSYNSVFQTIADDQRPDACYALAQLLGQIEGEKSRDLLVQLLDNENSVVQGEVVRQLSNQDSQFIGPILLAHLDLAGEGGIYPTFMDPVINRIDGGKIEIIKTLGQLKYKPAAKELLPLLETDQPALFELVVNVLIELESRDFVPYINNHLNKKTKPLILPICRIIADNDLKECKPSLMEFISTHNRNDHPGYGYSISKYSGLAHFDDQETKDFLMNDFENLLSENDSIEIRKLQEWIRAYIEVFTDLKCDEARPLIYQSLYKWFGYNSDFALHPELFAIKKNLEDSINQKALQTLHGETVQKIQSLVFITNTADFGDNFIPRYETLIQIKLDQKVLKLTGDSTTWKKLEEVKEKVSNELHIPDEQITSTSGAYVSKIEDRFDVNIMFSPMYKFYMYAKELPNETDLKFLKALSETEFLSKDSDKQELKKTIEFIEEKLKK